MRVLRLFSSFCAAAAVMVVLLFADPSLAAAPQQSGDITPPVSTAVKSVFEISPVFGAQVLVKQELIQVARKNKRRKKRKKWKKIRRAIGAAIITGIVINEVSRSSRGRYEGRGQCHRWRRSCDRGYEEACRAYYRNCD